MPTIDFRDIGEVLSCEFLQGTIKTIDSATDTCTVDVAGTVVSAPIFYHCEPDSVLLDNGAVEGAAAGFTVEDLVFVYHRIKEHTYKVIGHVDGKRHCEGVFSVFIITENPADPIVSIDILPIDIAKIRVGESDTFTYTFTERPKLTLRNFPNTGHNEPPLSSVSWSTFYNSYVLFYLMPSSRPPETYDAMVALVNATRLELDGTLDFAGLCNVHDDMQGSLNDTGKFNLIGVETTPAVKYWVRFHEAVNPTYTPLNILSVLDKNLNFIPFLSGAFYDGDSRYKLITDPVPVSEFEARLSDGMTRLSDGTLLWWHTRQELDYEHGVPTVLTAMVFWKTYTVTYERQLRLWNGTEYYYGESTVTSETASFQADPGDTTYYVDYGWDINVSGRVKRIVQQTVYLKEISYPGPMRYDSYSYTTFRYVDSNVIEVDLPKSAINILELVTCVVECGDKLVYALKTTIPGDPPPISCQLRLCPDKNRPQSYTVLKNLSGAVFTDLGYRKSKDLVFAYQSSPPQIFAFDMNGAERYHRLITEGAGSVGVRFTTS